MIQSQFVIPLVIVVLSGTTFAAEQQEIQAPSVLKSEEEVRQACYAEEVKNANGQVTAKAIRKACREKLSEVLADKAELSPLEERLKAERAVRDNPAVITPHKRNYILPFTYVDKPNQDSFDVNGVDVDLDNFEAKFQLSFKAPVASDIIQDDDVIFFGFTIQSYWQMYNSEISSPFRETNYQPEFFYGFMNDFTVGEWTNLVNVIGIEHQSNGRSQPLSRSWNRIYAQFVWENDNWVFMFKPWYRLPEKEKTAANQPNGDDNPDIGKYMGSFEFSSMYQWDDQTFGVMLRNNLKTEANKGAIQLDWTFPMGTRFKGYAQVFSGYGESMIDYNHSTTRIGIGVLLTDVF